MLTRGADLPTADVQVQHQAVPDEHLLNSLRLDFTFDVVFIAAQDQVADLELPDPKSCRRNP